MVPLRTVLLFLFATTASAATFQVTNVNDLGLGSLREAVTGANAGPGADLITFNIPGAPPHVIALASPLSITGPVTLDGSTDPGVVIGGNIVALDAGSAGSTVDTLAFSGVTGDSSLLVLSGGNQILRSTFSGGGTGVSIRAGDANRVENSEFFDCTLRGVHVANSATNTVVRLNDIHDNGFGVHAQAAAGTTIALNLISGNGTGIEGNATVTGNQILANDIGITGVAAVLTIVDNEIANNRLGINLANTGTGTIRDNEIASNSEYGIYDNRSGGTYLTETNDFHNNGAGVLVAFGGWMVLSRNLFDDHAGLPIRLNGAGNGLQSYPVLTSAQSDGIATTVIGTLTSTPSTTFTIELFSDAVPHSSGRGEAKQFLGDTTVTTDAGGNTSFTASVAPSNPGVAVTATATGPKGTSEFAANVIVTAAPPHPSADLSVTINDAPDPVERGQVLTYSITLANHGPSAASNVVLSLPAPAGTTFESVAQTGGAPFACNPSSCTAAQLASGASATFAVQVRVTTGASSVSGQAGAGSSTHDPNSSNNTALASTTVVQAPTGADVFALLDGSALSLHALIGNHGPEAAPDARLVITIPAGATALEFSSDTLSCAQVDATIVCDAGTLPFGSTGDVTVQVHVATGSVLVFEARAETSAVDPDPRNNDATHLVHTGAVVTLDAIPSPVRIGQVFTLTATADQPDVALRITLPAQFEVVSAPKCSGTSELTCSSPARIELRAPRTHGIYPVTAVALPGSGQTTLGIKVIIPRHRAARK